MPLKLSGKTKFSMASCSGSLILLPFVVTFGLEYFQIPYSGFFFNWTQLLFIKNSQYKVFFSSYCGTLEALNKKISFFSATALPAASCGDQPQHSLLILYHRLTNLINAINHCQPYDAFTTCYSSKQLFPGLVTRKFLLCSLSVQTNYYFAWRSNKRLLTF